MDTYTIKRGRIVAQSAQWSIATTDDFGLNLVVDSLTEYLFMVNC